MRRSVVVLSVLLGFSLLSGCSGGGPYCDAVKESQGTLTSFGQRTDAAYDRYAKATTSIAKVAPETTKKQWRQIARATRGVESAQKKAGISLQDMKSEEKVNALSADDIDKLNQAYEAFNETKDQRKAVVADVQDVCGVDLAPDEE